MTKLLKKSAEDNLSAHLSHNEFRCKCSRTECHFTLVDEHLINCFEKLRARWEKPILVNSGFRCQAHNKATNGSVPNSRHTTGEAIDLRKPSDPEQAKLFQQLCKDIFPHIIPYKGFVHCDLGDNN